MLFDGGNHIMNEKKLDQIANELAAIKKLLILLLQHKEVKGENIAKALGISKGRVSQMSSTKTYKKKKEVSNA
jgi:DNA-directed RNA polymerase specialized sigma subunit